MRILLVDDSKVMRGLQKRCLAALGEHEFAEANDGVEALAVLAASTAKFDFVLIDWNMPNMDGLTLASKIRATDKATPLIMCTTEAERERVMSAIQAGVNNYVVKPFTAESLSERVKQTLDKLKAA
ncbi:response regulator [bacterium]|nr:MAG: response regulator [bacterium]